MPTEDRSDASARSRTKWDEKAQEARAALIEQAARQLVTHGIDGICSTITPSALARSSGIVSVDTAYRLLGNPEGALEAVVDTLVSPEFSSDALNWPTLSAVTAEAVDSFEAEPSPLEAAVAALRFYIEGNFHLAARPIGRLLDAVAVTASELWEGDLRVSDERLEAARHILDARREAIEYTTEHFRWVLQEAMSDLQRRPKPGVTIEQMLMLMHSLIDGALDRMFACPGCITVDQLATAVVELGLSMTEDGSMSDPRVPADSAARLMFTRLVTEADRIWSRGEAIEEVGSVALRIDASPETAAVLFPAVADLADSVVWSRVIAAGPATGPARPSAAMLSSALRRLALAADEVPDAVTLAATAGASGVLKEMEGFARDSATSANSPVAEPERVAGQLVHLAVQGMRNWSTIELLLDVFGRASEAE